MSEPLAARIGRQFQPGECLFREGEPGGEMMVIQEGRVLVTKAMDAQHAVLAELGPGDVVGELALVTGRPQNTTATAVEPTRCLALDASTLEILVATTPELAVRLLRELGIRAYALVDLLSVVSHRDATARMIACLARHAESQGVATEQGTWIGVQLSELARRAAVGRHELGDVEQALLRLRLVELSSDGVLVPDVARLYDFIEFAEM
jgi:CRP-like cAMP-binding protein